MQTEAGAVVSKTDRRTRGTGERATDEAVAAGGPLYPVLAREGEGHGSGLAGAQTPTQEEEGACRVLGPGHRTGRERAVVVRAGLSCRLVSPVFPSLAAWASLMIAERSPRSGRAPAPMNAAGCVRACRVRRAVTVSPVTRWAERDMSTVCRSRPGRAAAVNT